MNEILLSPTAAHYMKCLAIHFIKNWTQNNTYLNSVITNQVGGEWLVGVRLLLKLQLWLANVFCVILCFFFNDSYQYKIQLNAIHWECYKIKDDKTCI
jgi:hypothetical protein